LSGESVLTVYVGLCDIAVVMNIRLEVFILFHVPDISEHLIKMSPCWAYLIIIVLHLYDASEHHRRRRHHNDNRDQKRDYG